MVARLAKRKTNPITNSANEGYTVKITALMTKHGMSETADASKDEKNAVKDHAWAIVQNIARH